MSLGHMIRQHSLKAMQTMKVTTLMEAEVVSDPPELKIKLKGNDKLIIPKELIVVAEHLTKEFKREMKVEGKGKSTISAPLTASPKVGMLPNGYVPHVHDVTEISMTKADFEFIEGTGKIEYTNELKKGDKVMVITFEGGQKFFIMDRVVSYAKGD
ncbi:DUF2577 family protein [Brevibacillus dissolubilis]|uniref:DUF2577 family protein n=1 Tax=Brevibacillus dissolubilis TaxID=1844116 RepID=UPI001115E5C7|nr:DUF2577 family protein [Brevibacillus dissolubilis]